MKMHNRVFQLLIGLAIVSAAVSTATAAQFARPDQTHSTGGWTDVNASSLHAAIDETSPNTSDYIQSPNSNQVAHLGLSSVSDPVTGSGHIMRIRVNPREEGEQDVAVRLYQNSGNDLVANYSFRTSGYRQWQTFTYSLSAAQANSITDYADLSIRIENAQEGDKTLRVTWFEFEVPDVTVAPPTVTSPTFSAVTDSSATLGGNVTSDGGATVNDRGIEWGTSSGVYNAPISSGTSGTGVFTQSVGGLPPATTIYFRAWATNSVGTAYSSESSFTTNPAVPTVTSPTATAISPTSATLGGNVTGNGGATVNDRGIEWGTSPGIYNAPISSGSGGTGVFTQAVGGLPTGSTIYFRAWASNSAGTGYSSESSFTTLSLTAPTVASPSFASVTDMSAVLGGNVTSNGGASVSDRGIEWGTGSGVYNAPISSGTSGTGVFTQSVGGLPPATTIYFRAWASNTAGTGYSTESSFVTRAGPPQLPVVNNPTFTGVSGNTATLGGTIADDGYADIDAHGIEWGLTPSGPYPNSTDFGAGAVGPFANTVTGLTPNSTIYFRAWATNVAGTAYSVESSFVTPNVFQASNIVLELVAARSLRFSWSPGSGEGSIAVVRLQSTPESAPVDGADYTSESDFTLASETSGGSGNFVIYKGSGTSAVVHGLSQNTTYTISVYTWSGTGAQTDYMQANPAEIDQATNGPAMHNYDAGADCGNCHGNHGNSGLVPRGTNQEDVCKTCHNPLGSASAKIDFGLHGTPAHAADDMDCGSCHEVHAINAGSANTTESTHPLTLETRHNLSFIRANMDKYVATATTGETVFHHVDNDQAIEGETGFSINDARGVCQACHMQTSYYTHNSVATANQCHRGGSNDSCNNAQVVCTDCHDHPGGFAPTGGSCTGCHASTQGGTPPDDRRAVVAEFSRASSHIAFGSLQDADCVVCHAQSGNSPSHSHQDGFLTFKDTDDHSAMGFQLGDHTDPATSATEAAKLDGFCLSCHDSDGAQAEATPAAPFTNSIAPVDINTNWAASSHATDPLTCSGDGAFGCHGNGHGGMKLNLLAPDTPAATSPNFSEEEEGFCLNCHDGSPAAANIQSEFAKTYRHPVVDSEQGVGRDVECTSCHNPHEATASLGAPGAGTTARTTAGPLEGIDGTNTSGTSVSPAVFEYQVCFNCHETGTAPTPRQFQSTNVRQEFNGGKTSYHPVTANNTSASNMPSLINGWQNNSIMSCTNCHNNDNGTGPNGPHGSSWPTLLAARYDTTDPATYSATKYALCFNCHSASNITNESSIFDDHRKHIVEQDTPCNVCHDPHASDRPRLINFDTSVVTPHSGNGLLEFNWTSPGNGSCTLRCHGANHNNWSY